MIPELGHFALILGFTLACLLGVVPLWGAWRNNVAAMTLAPALALGVFVFLLLAFALLATAFLGDDFSVKVVAANSNSYMPAIYKFSAVWGNHEGSLLLWVLILSGWMVAVAQFSRGLPLPVLARVLGVMGLIAVGFTAFSLFTSNPFERLLPGTPAESAGRAAGDIVVAVDGVETTDRRSLYQAIWSRAPGDTLRVKVRRGDEVLEIGVEASSIEEYFGS